MKNLTHQEAIRLGLAVIQDPGIGLIVERHAPNLTVCPVCCVDDFTHQESCKLAARVEACWDWLETPGEGRPHELGALIYVNKAAAS